MSEKPSNDFELQAKVPGVGELTVKLYPDAWNRLLNGLKPWHWMIATVLGGTIGLHLIRPSIPLSPQLPSAPSTVQKGETNP